MSFADAEVAEKIDAGFIPVKLNCELLSSDLPGRYGVRGYPTYLVLDADGEELLRWTGYTPPLTLLMSLDRALKAAAEAAEEAGR